MCKFCHLQQPVDDLVPYSHVCLSHLYGALHLARLTCLLNIPGRLLLADRLRVMLLCCNISLMLLQKCMHVQLWPLLSSAERDNAGNCMRMGFGCLC